MRNTIQIRKKTPETQNLISKLAQEHEVIQSLINQIVTLSEDFATLMAVKDGSEEITAYQYSFLNNRRINLRQNLAHFKDGLTLHYQQEEMVLEVLWGDQVKQCLEKHHCRLLQKLTETEELLLNLSPAGVLFNGGSLKQLIGTLCHSIRALISMEGSLLEISGI